MEGSCRYNFTFLNTDDFFKTSIAKNIFVVLFRHLWKYYFKISKWQVGSNKSLNNPISACHFIRIQISCWVCVSVSWCRIWLCSDHVSVPVWWARINTHFDINVRHFIFSFPVTLSLCLCVCVFVCRQARISLYPTLIQLIIWTSGWANLVCNPSTTK